MERIEILHFFNCWTVSLFKGRDRIDSLTFLCKDNSGALDLAFDMAEKWKFKRPAVIIK